MKLQGGKTSDLENLILDTIQAAGSRLEFHTFFMQKTAGSYFCERMFPKNVYLQDQNSWADPHSRWARRLTQFDIYYMGHGTFRDVSLFNRSILGGHSHAVKQWHAHRDDELKSPLRIGSVRNPYSFLYSLWTWGTFLPDNPKYPNRTVPPGQTAPFHRLNYLALHFETFKDFVRTLCSPEISGVDAKMRAQCLDLSQNPYHWIFNDGHLSPLDIVLRSECMTDIVTCIGQAGGQTIPEFHPNHKVNVTNKPKDYLEEYDDEMIGWVQHRWGWLLEMFGYDLEGPTDSNVFLHVKDLDVSEYILSE